MSAPPFNASELAQNPLVKRVIAVLDKNKDGNISFLEFVQGLNALSAGASNEEKLRFAFQIYDINNDGFISNGELFTVLKMMVGNNLNDVQLQQLVDRTIIKADEDFDGKISFDEFKKVSLRKLTAADGQGPGRRRQAHHQLLRGRPARAAAPACRASATSAWSRAALLTV